MSSLTYIKTPAIVNVMPVWARLEICMSLSGLPDNVIRGLYNAEKIRARKVDPEKRNSACVYRVQDILDWVEEEAASPEKFALTKAEPKKEDEEPTS